MTMIDFGNVGEWKFYCFEDWQSCGEISCMLMRRDENGMRSVFQPDGIIRHLPIGDPIEKPSFMFKPSHLQALMDGLWERGIRPKDRRYENELELKDAHLQDMRKLVFKEAP